MPEPAGTLVFSCGTTLWKHKAGTLQVKRKGSEAPFLGMRYALRACQERDSLPHKPPTLGPFIATLSRLAQPQGIRSGPRYSQKIGEIHEQE